MSETSAESLEAEVRAASQAYLAALLRLDHSAAAACWTEDALLMPSGGPDLVGYHGIAAMMSENYPKIRFVEVEVLSREVRVSGDVAFEVVHYDERIGAPDGSDLELSGRYLFVWRCESPGVWKILRGMYNYTS